MAQSYVSFYGIGIAPKLLEALDRMHFTVPTPIQHKAIPLAIKGNDLIGVAQTGTGKTIAFAIPIIQRLAQQKGHCLVLAPTRELAVQVDAVFRQFAHLFGLESVVLIGGASINPQIQALKRRPRILVATPGRLIDHIERQTVLLADVSVLVLDEADRMLDMGFAPQIERILKYVPRNRQTMLFSATIPSEVLKIATAHMKLPIHIEVAPSGTTAERIIQELFIIKKDAKRQLLGKLLEQYRGSVLVFSRTKRGAAKIKRVIKAMGHKVAEIHSDRSLGQRRDAIEGFKAGRYRILVATDIAARGIDVIGIELVLNYDLPDDTENYVHRIGRTGRAGHEGRAISFATPDQGLEVKNIEKLIKTALPILEHPEFAKESFSSTSAQSGPPRSYQSQRRDRHSRQHRKRRFGSFPRHPKRFR
ncbi:DEAD/DEAH box helicase [Candidatus Omnitrophota bacterium]